MQWTLPSWAQCSEWLAGWPVGHVVGTCSVESVDSALTPADPQPRAGGQFKFLTNKGYYNYILEKWPLCQIMPYAMMNRICQNLCQHNPLVPLVPSSQGWVAHSCLTTRLGCSSSLTTRLGCSSSLTTRLGCSSSLTTRLGCSSSLTTRLGCSSSLTTRLGCSSSLTTRLGCSSSLTIRLGCSSSLTTRLGCSYSHHHKAGVLVFPLPQGWGARIPITTRLGCS